MDNIVLYIRHFEIAIITIILWKHSRDNLRQLILRKFIFLYQMSQFVSLQFIAPIEAGTTLKFK